MDRYQQEFNPGYNYVSYHAILMIKMMLAHNLVPKMNQTSHSLHPLATKISIEDC